MRFGRQVDMAGIIAPSEDADRAVRYLTKYLTKAIADTHTDPDGTGPGRRGACRPAARRAALPAVLGTVRELAALRHPTRRTPAPACSPAAAPSKAHDREHLGFGGRRVLVSRQWSGKTLAEHKADRATVVREALLAAGIVAPEIERMAADVTLPDGSPRFVWTDTRPDARTYARVLLASIAERQRWRAQYEAAKACAGCG